MLFGVICMVLVLDIYRMQKFKYIQNASVPAIFQRLRVCPLKSCVNCDCEANITVEEPEGWRRRHCLSLRKVVKSEERSPKKRGHVGYNHQRWYKCMAIQVLWSSHLPQIALDARHRTMEFNVCSAGFSSALAPFLIIPLFLPFGMGIFIMWHCMLEVPNFLFIFIEVHSYKFVLSPRREFETFSNVKP